MPSINEVQIGQRVSFEVYPVAALGNNFQNVLLDGILSARMAASYGVDIAAMHANVYPTLPPETPNDAFQYSYVRVQLSSGEYQVLGIPWIRPESIVIAEGGTLTLTFDNATQVDIDRILLALSSNGYRPSSVKTTAA